MTRFVVLTAALAASLLGAATAGATAPERMATHIVLGPFVDEGICPFPLTTVVERTRTTTEFASGDVRRHTHLVVTTSANGKEVVERSTFNVLMPAGSSTWVITGAFVHVPDPGSGVVALQSGRLLYDVENDRLIDPHSSPQGVEVPFCELLAP